VVESALPAEFVDFRDRSRIHFLAPVIPQSRQVMRTAVDSNITMAA